LDVEDMIGHLGHGKNFKCVRWKKMTLDLKMMQTIKFRALSYFFLSKCSSLSLEWLDIQEFQDKVGGL